MQAFRIIAKTAVAFYDELFHVALMGFVTLLACLLFIFAPAIFLRTYPALVSNMSQVGILAIAIALILVFSLPGLLSLAGLYAACQKTVRGEGMKWHHYWTGIKEFGLRTWLIFLGFLAGYGIGVANIVFYNTPEWSPFPPQLAVWLTPLWIVILVIWTFGHFYPQAFLMELVEPKFKYIYRNSALLLLLHPVATLIFVIVSVIVLAISIFVPVLLLFSPAFVIILALTAVRVLTAEIEERAKAMAEKDSEKASEEDVQTEDN